jgi:hypothetical protein
MELAVKILAAVFLQYYLIVVFGLPIKIKKVFKIVGRVRPFDCEYCLGFWIAFILFFLPVIWSQVVFVSFGAAYLSKYIK